MAITFDGASDYIACASDASIDNIAILTYTAWIRPTIGAADSYHIFIDKSNSAADGPYLAVANIAASANCLYFFRAFTDVGVEYGAWYSAANSVTTGVWQHVAVVYNKGATANDPIFYVNGVLSATTELHTPAGTADDDSAYNLILGLYTGGANGLDGELEDVRIFNSAKTVEQIALLAAGYRGPIGGEVLWLSMNEARTLATPGTLTQGTHLLPDLSVNSNDGDPYHSPVMIASDCSRMGVAV